MLLGDVWHEHYGNSASILALLDHLVTFDITKHIVLARLHQFEMGHSFLLVHLLLMGQSQLVLSESKNSNPVLCDGAGLGA